MSALGGMVSPGDLFVALKKSVADDIDALGPEMKEVVERVLARIALLGAAALSGQPVDEFEAAQVVAQRKGLESLSAAIVGKAVNATLIQAAQVALKVGLALLV